MTNNHDFPILVRRQLDRGLESLPQATVERLDATRKAALSHQKATSARLVLSGNLELALGLWAFRPRVFAAIALFVVVALGLGYAHGQRHIQQIQELDSAILIDALPPEAFLNKDFDRWLRPDAQF